MTDKEILEAMRSMLEAERGHTSQMMDEKLAAALEAEREHTSRIIDEKLAAVKADTAKIDKIIPKINGLYESVVGTGEKFLRLDELADKVDDHDHRIWALEHKAI